MCYWMIFAASLRECSTSNPLPRSQILLLLFFIVSNVLMYLWSHSLTEKNRILTNLPPRSSDATRCATTIEWKRDRIGVRCPLGGIRESFVFRISFVVFIGSIRFGICVCVCVKRCRYLFAFVFYFRRSHSGAHTKYDLRFPSFFFCVCFVVKCSRLVYVLLLVLVS